MSEQSRMQLRDAAVQAQPAGSGAYGENSHVAAVAQASQGPDKTRAQLRAEPKQAQRLGLTQVVKTLPLASAAQFGSIEMAGLRALAGSSAAERWLVA